MIEIAAMIVALTAAAAPAPAPGKAVNRCSPMAYTSLERDRAGLFRLRYPLVLGARFDERTHPELFAPPQSSFDGSLVIIFSLMVDAAGNARSPLAVDSVTVNMGNLLEPFAAPVDRLAINVNAGGTSLPPFALVRADYRANQVTGDFHRSSGVDYPEGRTTQAALDRLGRSIDNKPVRATLTVAGRPAAALDYAPASLAEAKSDGLAWAGKTAKLMAQGRCE